MEKPELYRPVVFNLDNIKESIKFLDENGFIIFSIPSINNDDLIDTFRKDLKSINKNLDMEKNIFDYKLNLDYPAGNMNQLLGEYGLCHGDAAWTVKCNNDIQKIFSEILNEKDLVCSFDAIGFSTNDCIETGQNWLHVDQYEGVDEWKNIKSYQGIYYATDTTDLTATTIVVPKTHNKYRLTSNVEEKYWKDAKRLLIKKGELVIFNSRTIHQGWYSKDRLCFMVSYAIKKERTEESLNTKIMFYKEGIRTTHWAQFPYSHGPKNNLRLFLDNKDIFSDLQPKLIENNIPDERLRLL